MAYGYKRSLTIDHTKCGSVTQVNCPVLVSITSSTFRLVANGGHLTSASAYDVAFYSDSTLTSPLSWEIVSYTEATGAFAAWVRIPSLSVSADTVFYVAYGDSLITTLQSTASAVWDSNYAGVWHFKDGTTLSGLDSTANANNSSSISAAATTGQLDGGAAFNGTTQTIAIPNQTSLNFTGSLTIEAWFYETDTSNYRAITSKGASPARSISLFLTRFVQDSVVYNDAGALALSAGWVLSTWNHLVLTDTGGSVVVYLNGSSVSSGTAGSGNVGNASNLYIGYDSDEANFPFSGSLDEIRISNVVRSSSWVTTQYNSQFSPTTFITVGPEGAVTQNTISTISHLFGFFDMGDFRI